MTETQSPVIREVEARRDALVALCQDLIRIPTLNPPGRDYLEICEMLGERLRGTAEQCGLGDRRMIQSIVFSKALGSFGGAILGPRWLRAALLDGNPVVTGSSSWPAGLAKATLASLELLRARPGLAKRLRA